MKLTCQSCKLVWEEDRDASEEPMKDKAFVCPRCTTVASPDGSQESGRVHGVL
jgi:predicted metal-binding protein